MTLRPFLLARSFSKLSTVVVFSHGGDRTRAGGGDGGKGRKVRKNDETRYLPSRTKATQIGEADHVVSRDMHERIG